MVETCFYNSNMCTKVCFKFSAYQHHIYQSSKFTNHANFRFSYYFSLSHICFYKSQMGRSTMNTKQKYYYPKCLHFCNQPCLILLTLETSTNYEISYILLSPCFSCHFTTSKHQKCYTCIKTCTVNSSWACRACYVGVYVCTCMQMYVSIHVCRCMSLHVCSNPLFQCTGVPLL